MRSLNLKLAIMGSPPQVRVKENQRKKIMLILRITPAGAGKR